MKPSLFIQLFKTKVGIILMCFLPLIGFGIFQINSIYYSKAKSNLIDKAFIIKQPVINYLNNNQNLLNEISIQGEALIKNKFNLESYGDQLSKIINI